ncbi:AGAP008578-PA-like protein [Anopheles sinensis]|uniref:AGAP008578-PA-like protein n=1 Tax=Anopheles sinensis TaxID=74873 RepID=A0A084VV24_ANOSI|nr:AGAP008578-PA-like protein [Anopheles sinensis]
MSNTVGTSRNGRHDMCHVFYYRAKDALSNLRLELPVLRKLTEEEAGIFGSDVRPFWKFPSHDDLFVGVYDEDVPLCLEGGFRQCALGEAVHQNMGKAGIFLPTPVQCYVIPILLAGRDLYMVSDPGVGNIASFVLPMVQLVLNQEILEMTVPQPYVLIISPTRQTTRKTYAEARKFAYGTAVKVCVVDSSDEAQQREMETGCHILVVTPVWLMHLRAHRNIAFRNVKAVVLYDVDTIIQLGLRTTVEYLMKDPTMPAKEHRQMIIYSRSIHGPIPKLTATYMKKPIIMYVKIYLGASQNAVQNTHRDNEPDAGGSSAANIKNEPEDDLEDQEDELVPKVENYTLGLN